MNYQQLLTELDRVKDSSYREFHCRLLHNNKINVIGVRVPALRSIAQKFIGHEDELMTFPNAFYEVTFIKLITVSLLPYERFVEKIDACVALIDNWAACDCFKARCISKHRDEFLPYVRRYLSVDGEFYQRYALTTLLAFYVEKPYLDVVYDAISLANTEYYYTHMAAAWLLAEVLCKYFDEGVEYLKSNTLDVKTHNKAIRKAMESLRISEDNKKILQALKR